MKEAECIQHALELPGGARFYKCALQVNPFDYFRDYRYIEATGLGIPRKIIRGIREHNGTEPDLIEEEDRFTVRLWAEGIDN